MSVPDPEPEIVVRPVLLSRNADQAQPNTEFAAEVVVNDNDARLDEDLLDRHVECTNHAPDVLQALCSILNQQGIGSIVDTDATAVRQHGVAA